MVRESDSLADIIRKIGFAIESKNYNLLKKRLREDDIDFSHIPLGLASNKGKVSTYKGKDLQSVLTQGSTYCKKTLKRRLLKSGLLENRCYAVGCNVTDKWLQKSITLQLDHINGDRTDDRLSNLQLLCPNCHTQTVTWGGKSRMPRSSNGQEI